MSCEHKHKLPDIQSVVGGFLEPLNDPLNFSFYLQAKYTAFQRLNPIKCRLQGGALLWKFSRNIKVMKLLNKHTSPQQTEIMKDVAFVKCSNEGHFPATPLASCVCSTGVDYSGNEIFGALSLTLQKKHETREECGTECCPSSLFCLVCKSQSHIIGCIA